MVIPKTERSDVTDEKGGAKEGASSSAGKRQISYSNPSEAEKLRDLLRRADLSQRGAARELGVDERTMRYWCAGEHVPPRMAILALERLIDMRRMVTEK